MACPQAMPQAKRRGLWRQGLCSPIGGPGRAEGRRQAETDVCSGCSSLRSARCTSARGGDSLPSCNRRRGGGGRKMSGQSPISQKRDGARARLKHYTQVTARPVAITAASVNLLPAAACRQHTARSPRPALARAAPRGARCACGEIIGGMRTRRDACGARVAGGAYSVAGTWAHMST